MNCAEFEELLHKSGRTEEEQKALSAHASACPSCLMLMDLYGMDADRIIPLSAAKKWREAVREEEAKQNKRAFPNWAKYASVAAGLVILAVGSARIGRINPDHAARNSAVPAATAANAPAPRGTNAPTQMPAAAPAAIFNSVPKAAPVYEAADAEEADSAADAFFPEEEEEMLFAEEAPAAGAAGYHADMYDGGAAFAAQESAQEDIIVQTADVQVDSPAFDEDLALITNEVLAAGGRITATAAEQGAGEARRVSLMITLPAEELDGFLAVFDQLQGTVTQREVTEKGITGSSPGNLISFSTVRVTLTEETP